jgi:hypothetical protein
MPGLTLDTEDQPDTLPGILGKYVTLRARLHASRERNPVKFGSSAPGVQLRMCAEIIQDLERLAANVEARG